MRFDQVMKDKMLIYTISFQYTTYPKIIDFIIMAFEIGFWTVIGDLGMGIAAALMSAMISMVMRNYIRIRLNIYEDRYRKLCSVIEIKYFDDVEVAKDTLSGPELILKLNDLQAWRVRGIKQVADLILASGEAVIGQWS